MQIEYKKLSDKELFRRFVQGEDPAISALFQISGAHLADYGSFLLENSSDGSELIQKTYIRANKNLRDRFARTDIKSWYLSSLKKITQKKVFMTRDELLDLFDYENIKYELSAKDFVFLTAEDSLLKSDVVRSVYNRINEMKPEYKDVLELFVIDGLSVDKISPLFQLQDEITRVRLHRGYEVLRNSL